MSPFSILRRSLCTVTPKKKSNASLTKSLFFSLSKERDLKIVTEKFKKCCEIKSFRYKVDAYKQIVKKLANVKQYDMIEEILEDQKKYRSISKEGFNVRIISLYGNHMMFKQALNTFDQMPDVKCPRTVKSLNAILGACVSCKQFDEMSRLFKQLPSQLSIKPDLFSYNILVKGYCNNNNFDSAISVLDDMKKAGTDPNFVTFNTLIHEAYSSGLHSEGDRILSLMKAAGVAPDTWTYNAMIIGKMKERKIQEALKIVTEMDANEIKLDLVTFNELIAGFCTEGDLEKIKQWYKKMVAVGCAPNKFTFNEIITCACGKGDLDLAVEMCRDLFKQKYKVDQKLPQMVINLLVKESKMKEAYEIVGLGNSKKHRGLGLKILSS